MFVCVTFKCMPVPVSIHAARVTFVVKKHFRLQRSPLPGARCRLRSRRPASPRLGALVSTPIRPHRPAGRLGRPAGQTDCRAGRRAGGDDRPGGRGRRVLRAGEEGGEARTGGGTDEPRLHHVRVSPRASFYCGFTTYVCPHVATVASQHKGLLRGFILLWFRCTHRTWLLYVCSLQYTLVTVFLHYPLCRDIVMHYR